tara:strand:+ start:678 stop:854 length:177 start_codon:yes stop_codon:yes gene_type:complete
MELLQLEAVVAQEIKQGVLQVVGLVVLVLVKQEQQIQAVEDKVVIRVEVVMVAQEALV